MKDFGCATTKGERLQSSLNGQSAPSAVQRNQNKEQLMNNFIPVNNEEYSWLMEVMEKNKGKSFVKRILEPNKYPTLDVGNGSYATHQMAYSQVGDKYYVYPTVLHNGRGSLEKYTPKDAFHAAVTKNNYIVFPNESGAKLFSERYKGAWGGQQNNPPK